MKIKPETFGVQYNQIEERIEILLTYNNGEKYQAFFLSDDYNGKYLTDGLKKLLDICINGTEVKDKSMET